MKHENDRISYETILAAKNGDISAIKEILEHHDSYIDYYSQRTLFDMDGMPYTYFDEEIKSRIQAKLLFRIMNDFDPTKKPADENKK